MIGEYETKSKIWTELVPQAILLSIQTIKEVQDRDALKGAFDLLIYIFDQEPKKPQIDLNSIVWEESKRDERKLQTIQRAQANQGVNLIWNQLKEKQILFQLLQMMFYGVVANFERYIVGKCGSLLYNISQWNNDKKYILTIFKTLLFKYETNSLSDKDKELFINALSNTSNDKKNDRRMRQLVTDMYSVCRALGTPDTFGAFLDPLDQ